MRRRWGPASDPGWTPQISSPNRSAWATRDTCPQPYPPSGAPRASPWGLGTRRRVKRGPGTGQAALAPAGSEGGPNLPMGLTLKGASAQVLSRKAGRSGPHLGPRGPTEASSRASHGCGRRPAGPSWDPPGPLQSSPVLRTSALEKGPRSEEGVRTGRKLRLRAQRAGCPGGLGRGGGGGWPRSRGGENLRMRKVRQRENGVYRG